MKKLYHVSREEVIGVRTFFPILQQNELKAENGLPPRVCAATSIEKCLLAIKDSLFYYMCENKKFAIKLHVYEFVADDVKKFVAADASKVTDATITGEHYAVEAVRATKVDEFCIICDELRQLRAGKVTAEYVQFRGECDLS